MIRRRSGVHLGCFALVALAACAAPTAPGSGKVAPLIPYIDAMSTFEASVGEPVRFFGGSFIPANEGWVDVVWRGEFLPDDGSAPEPVDLTIPLQVTPTGDVLWHAFGLYRIPFGRGDRIGVFEGTVTPINQTFTGESYEGQGGAIRFRVLPSIIVTDFRAMGETWVADCKEPAPNALNLVPYGMRVQAVGFEPYFFEYYVSEGLLRDGQVTREVTQLHYPTATGELSHALMMQFGPVPEHVDGYAMSIRVRSHGLDGGVRELLYPFTVRRPLQIYFRGPMQIAELYEPEPVSSCIPGGPSSVGVHYSEVVSETRTRAITNSVDRGWDRSYGESFTETYGMDEGIGGSSTVTDTVTMTDTRSSGGSVTNTDSFSRRTGRSLQRNVGFSQSDSNSYGWNIGDETVDDFMREVGGGVSGDIKVISINGQGKVGWVDGTRHREGMDGSVGRTTTRNEGESQTVDESEEIARARAEGYHWDRAISYSEANSFSQTQSWSQSRSYSEATSHSSTVGERLSVGESVLESVSTTTSTSLDVTAHVWAGQYGVWYRQTARLIRFGAVVAYDLCGNGDEVGEISLDDWTWAPDLAIGDECPPATNLPPAQCRIPPCSTGR